MDGVVKDLAAFLEWIEHHGVIVSILSLCIGGAGTRAWDKFENRRELTVEKSAISLSSNDDIKVLVLEKPTVSLTIITVSIRNTGRRDLKEQFPVTIKTDKGTLLRCKIISASTGASCNLPVIDAPVHEITFDVLPLQKGEYIQVQVYADEASRKDIEVKARPIGDVKVKTLDFGEAKPGTDKKLEQAVFLLLIYPVILAALADRHPDAKDLAWFAIAGIVFFVGFLYSLRRK